MDACYLSPIPLVIRCMKRIGALVIGFVLLVGLLVITFMGVTGAGAFSPVYTVAELRADVAHAPRAWLGRTVLVRGTAVNTFARPMPSTPPVMRPLPSVSIAPVMHPLSGSLNATARLRAITGTSAISQSNRIRSWIYAIAFPMNTAMLDGGLLVTWGGEDPLLARLRSLPLVGQFAPPPQRLRWGTPSVYRVRIKSLGSSVMCSPNKAPCYAAELLDAAPVAVASYSYRPWMHVPPSAGPIRPQPYTVPLHKIQPRAIP